MKPALKERIEEAAALLAPLRLRRLSRTMAIFEEWKIERLTEKHNCRKFRCGQHLLDNFLR